MPPDRAAVGETPLVLSAAFRIFFLLAGLAAVLNGLAWLTWLGLHAAGGAILRPSFSVAPHLWHGHEMIFGYALATVAGFFLTAVPSWTGTQPLGSRPLILLAAVWIAGRVAIWASAVLPAPLVALCDLAFVPLLAYFAGRALCAKPAPRNLIVLALLGFLFASNLMAHLDWLDWMPGLATRGLAGGILSLITLIGMIGGRVVPAFTRNALVAAGHATGLPQSHKPLEAVSIGTLWLLLIARLFEAPDMVLALLASVGALAHGARLFLWRGPASRGMPIVWSLHLGYAWLPIGLAALALAYGSGILPESAALHALAVGGVGGMTLAVMTRAALGHSGRALVVARPIAWAYGMVALAAALRVFAPALVPGLYMTWILGAGAVWTLAFLIYLAVYWPVLTGPQVRGKP